MIDFRYHLVSIIAVFLALAIGIVVGATALQPATVKLLNAASVAEKQRRERCSTICWLASASCSCWLQGRTARRSRA